MKKLRQLWNWKLNGNFGIGNWRQFWNWKLNVACSGCLVQEVLAYYQWGIGGPSNYVANTEERQNCLNEKIETTLELETERQLWNWKLKTILELETEQTAANACTNSNNFKIDPSDKRVVWIGLYKRRWYLLKDARELSQLLWATSNL